MRRCHKCGAEWASEKKQPSVKEICPECSAFLHCCLNCRFYDPTVHNSCQIGTTEWVGDKAGQNFCDEFVFADTDAQGQSDADAEKDRARQAVQQLLGGSETRKPGLDDFERLFGD